MRGKLLRQVSPSILATLALVYTVATGRASPAPGTQRNLPSVILISVDTLRADHLGCYGYRHVQTPHIDALTQGGTLFTQVNAQVPLTFPSHASLLTSRFPFADGIEDNGEQLEPNAVTIATVLRSRGYRTAAFVGSFVLDRRFGLSQGFDVYDSPFEVSSIRVRDPGEIKRPGEEVVKAASEWVDKNSSGPFFVFLHLYDLHTPYYLPPRFRERYGHSGYDGQLAYMDEVLGEFLQSLDQQGLRDNVLLVFTSDHGEGLGEHAEGAHGYFIYQSTLWVPLIFRWPSGTGPFPVQFNEPTGLLNVAPTILQFLDVAPPPQFQGHSLLGMLQGKSSAGPGEVYSESLYGQRHFAVGALRSLRLGRYKYIDAPKPELYDLLIDPRETRNLFSTQNGLALSLREKLSSVRLRFGAAGAKAPKVVSPEVLARLSSLGYVAVSAGQPEFAGPRPDPKDRIAAFNRYSEALTMASKGRVTDSRAILKQLLAEDEDSIDLRVSYGLTLQELGQHLEAAEEFRRVLRKDPLNVLAHFDLGVSNLALRRTDDAVKELEATLAIAPYYTRADELLGKTYLEKQDYPRARSHFEHLLTFEPNDFNAHYSLGALAVQDHQWDDALTHLRAAVSADPRSAEAHNVLGSFYLLRGDLEGAGQELTAALQLDPQFAQAHYNLGLVFEKRAENQKAAQQYRLALQADPGLTAAREALNSIGYQP